MNRYNNQINLLLALLNTWFPISQSFKQELTKKMQLQPVKAKQLLNFSGKHINHAWFNVDCWIIEQRITETGKEEISAIYGPNTIVTDITSFLKGETSHRQLIVINGSTLLKIDRKHFNLLRSYPETPLLLEHYLLLKQASEQWRLDLMLLPDNQKFNLFAAHYPINQLPGKLCASFLRMTPSRYSAAKKLYNRSK